MSTNLRYTPSDAELLDMMRQQVSHGVARDARERVSDRVNRTIEGLLVDPNVASPKATSPLGWLRGAPRALGSRPAWFAVAVFASGAVVGAGVHARFARGTPDRIIYVDRLIEGRTAAPSVGSSQASGFPDIPSAAGATPSNAAPPMAMSATESGLVTERALLDRARRALGAGEYDVSQRLLDIHARRFSSGLLREEREALQIKVLAATGRTAEARKRASLFRERFPGSLFGAAVDETMLSIP